MSVPIISFNSCSISIHDKTVLHSISFSILRGDICLISGMNGAGKTTLASAIAQHKNARISPDNSFLLPDPGKVRLVSFERANDLIEEERKTDDSDFTEGGIHPGRTVRKLLGETTSESQHWIKLCGIESLLDRGLKYLSTGEIRRSLLCQVLLQAPDVIILDEPFEGLDTESRSRLETIIELLSAKGHTICLVMDRPDVLLITVNHVLVLQNGTVVFNGTESEYHRIKDSFKPCIPESTDNGITGQLPALDDWTIVQAHTPDYLKSEKKPETLVSMNKVCVEWSGNRIIDNLSWTIRSGEHWLLRGPNGSGKTSLLELITGDNPQVFRNDVSLFGNKRGSGETVWEIKARLGIVSYRLHQEYRLLGSIPVEEVLLSGFYDSIGLYDSVKQTERDAVKTWLSLARMDHLYHANFANLSYGEQRAIVILRAVLKGPLLLVLDEPCHSLDSFYRTFILNLLQAIALTGKTTLLHVTHDPAEVLPCEHNILELRPGEQPMYHIMNRQSVLQKHPDVFE